MTLKRPVTLAAARRWPAAAARRESFCARMGGMREKLTSDRTARDPRSKINRALAAWDCDEPELLQPHHVTKGVRPMRITKKMVGAEAKKNPSKGPSPRANRALRAAWTMLKMGETKGPQWSALARQLGYTSGARLKESLVMRYGEPTKSKRRKPTVFEKISQLTHEGYPQRQAVAIALSEQRAGKVRSNPDTWGTAPLGKVRSVMARQKATGELRTFLMADTSGKRVPTPYHFGFRLNLEGENLDFVGRYSGPLLIVSEKSTGLRLPGDVPFSKRSAYGNDKEAAKSWTLDLVERVGARKLVDKVKAAR